MQMNVAVKIESVTHDGPNDIACGISDDLNAVMSVKSLGIAI